MTSDVPTFHAINSRQYKSLLIKPEFHLVAERALNLQK